MPENEKLIEELNDLILINNDRIEKYNQVLKDSRSSEEISLLKKMIHQSIHYNIELSEEISNKSRNRNWKSLTKPGKIYKMWADLISSITDKTRLNISETSEIVELAILKAYHKALSPDIYIPSEITSLLFMQKAKLKESYDILNGRRSRNLAHL